MRGRSLFDGPAVGQAVPAQRLPPVRITPERWYDTLQVHKAGEMPRGLDPSRWPMLVADLTVLTAAAEGATASGRSASLGYGKYPGGWLRAKCWLGEPGVQAAP